jgi:hypothetical protein
MASDNDALLGDLDGQVIGNLRASYRDNTVGSQAFNQSGDFLLR